MKKTLCILTIGQSPRADMIPVISKYLPENLKLIEKGILDELSTEEIKALAPVDSKKTLVSRLRDGSSVTLGEQFVITALQRLIDECQTEAIDTILLACTGRFKPFDSGIPIVYPDYLLSHVIKGLFKEGELGIVVPLLEQAQSIKEKWNDTGFSCIIYASTPYDFQYESFINAAKQMDNLPVKAVMLDCMGYTDEMKKIMVEYTSKPVLVARNIVFSSLAEML